MSYPPTAVVPLNLVERLQRWIEQQALEPGMRLPAERQLAAQLGVSRSSLREALQQLISSGLLTSRRGGGTWLCQPLASWSEQQIVAPIRPLLAQDPDYGFDVLEARYAIEGGTAWYAALRATAADKERLQLAFDATLKIQQHDDPQLAAQADVRFHLAIAEASHNLVLLQTMRGFFTLLHSSVQQSREHLYLHPKVFAQLTDQHQTLLAAILAGEPESARQAATAHLSFVHSTLKGQQEDEARLARITRLPGVEPL